MDVASINPNSSYGMNNREQYLWNQLEEAEEVTDLDLDVFDSVEVDHSLPDNTPAVTRHKSGLFYDKTTLAVNENFFYFPEEEQNHILTHEGIHGNEFNNTLNNQLRDLGLSNESIEFFNQKMRSSRDEMEGTVEYITHLLDPNSDNLSLRSYPYQTEKIRKEVKNKGLTPDSELTREIDAYADSILDDYIDQEAYNVELDKNYNTRQSKTEDTHYRDDLETHGENYISGLLEDAEDYLRDVTEEIQDYVEDLSDKYNTVADYLTDSDYEMPYGEGANYIGNIDQGHKVPLSASMGTPVNGNEA